MSKIIFDFLTFFDLFFHCQIEYAWKQGFRHDKKPEVFNHHSTMLNL